MAHARGARDLAAELEVQGSGGVPKVTASMRLARPSCCSAPRISRESSPPLKGTTCSSPCVSP